MHLLFVNKNTKVMFFAKITPHESPNSPHHHRATATCRAARPCSFLGIAACTCGKRFPRRTPEAHSSEHFVLFVQRAAPTAGAKFDRNPLPPAIGSAWKADPHQPWP